MESCSLRLPGEAGSTGRLTYDVERVHEVVLLGGSKRGVQTEKYRYPSSLPIGERTGERDLYDASERCEKGRNNMEAEETTVWFE